MFEIPPETPKLCYISQYPIFLLQITINKSLIWLVQKILMPSLCEGILPHVKFAAEHANVLHVTSEELVPRPDRPNQQDTISINGSLRPKAPGNVSSYDSAYNTSTSHQPH